MTSLPKADRPCQTGNRGTPDHHGLSTIAGQDVEISLLSGCTQQEISVVLAGARRYLRAARIAPKHGWYLRSLGEILTQRTARFLSFSPARMLPSRSDGGLNISFGQSLNEILFLLRMPNTPLGEPDKAAPGRRYRRCRRRSEHCPTSHFDREKMATRTSPAALRS